ncbi:MAG: bifunctional (p)ppGpp synthetase/guanosine-3',5'-bis(diphosphate) 3'-pyrophosphohydrolase [Dehalococcoidales bacterium]|nr:bifunctional (p)ppGpp synthetase/guanosine-3',5'-bis(diphosphate) 3'-pyrophosphohydrolase [Dehalococcoidales bacterium]
MMGFSELMKRAGEYLPPEKMTIVKDAYDFAMKAHEGQLRKSGEPYLEHPLHVALTLAELQLDASSLAAALLHDVSENCQITISEIEAKFGPEVAKLVDGTTKLGKLTLQRPEGAAQLSKGSANGQKQAENLRKMLVAMAEDLRVVFIKLADRLHNMSTLDALPPDKRRSIAHETLEVYAPLAHRLGIWELKWQLEDLSFRYLEPRKYHQIARLIANRGTEREDFIAQAIKTLSRELDLVGIKAEVSGRLKNIYSINQKIEKYAALDKDFDSIHDLIAVRILVSTVPDCYSVLGAVHNLWHPLPDQFNDFIANPKPNGYQSLHTTVMCQGTTPLEVQIRTYQMHHVAEYGVAAHWRYKEGEKQDVHFEERISWLRQLIEWHRELSGAEEFLESVKTDIFIDQVFVYTPKGDIKDLPKGSTPLDFAYRIHTDLGHRCIGAKVNGRLVTLNYHLKNGDLIEIMTAKTSRGPSRDWLNPELGYVNTSQARGKIRQWFQKLERTENIERGRELLEKMIKQLDLKLMEREKLAKLLKYDTMDDFYAAIGDGDVTTHQIVLRLAAQQQQPRIATVTPPQQPPSVVKVQGTKGMLTHLAQCCHPVPGDKIIGYVTRSRGVTIHQQNCYNVVHEDEKDRLISVEWGEGVSLYPVKIQVQAWDRVGLVRDITTLIADEKINIASASTTKDGDQTASTLLTLETASLEQLSRLLTKIERIRGVKSAARIGDGALVKSDPQAGAVTQK